MTKSTQDAESALRKLGERIRHGYEVKHPASQRSIDTIRKAASEQYDAEQKALRDKPPTATPSAPSKKRSPRRKQ